MKTQLYTAGLSGHPRPPGALPHPGIYILPVFPPPLRIWKKKIIREEWGKRRKEEKREEKRKKGKRGGKSEEKKGIVVKKRENIHILLPCLIIGPYDHQKYNGRIFRKIARWGLIFPDGHNIYPWPDPGPQAPVRAHDVTGRAAGPQSRPCSHRVRIFRKRIY